jgi:Ca2+-binding EF-hand superfamily protein
MAELSPHRKSKLHARFDQLDIDGDGFLQASDYQTLGRLLADRLNSSDSEREAIYAGYGEHWRQLHTHADVDHDGRVSRNEYVAAMAAAAGDPELLDRAVLQTARAIMAAADADDDGYLDFADYERLAELMRIRRPAESFRILDADGDGRVSQEELVAAIRDFYTSDDPTAAGSFVFGYID